MIRYRPIEWPIENPPKVGASVDRWYQLDLSAKALLRWWELENAPQGPDAIVLASPGGSNESDGDFVDSGLSSPQKFVHTLPSVRGTPLCQAMGWMGPVLCVQRDPYTLSQGLQVASDLTQTYPHLWVLGVRRETPSLLGVAWFSLTFANESSSNLIGLTDDEIWSHIKNGIESNA